jgi:glc operon protein GlcG
MYEKPQLGTGQVQTAMQAMLDTATRTPHRPVAIAIVDDMAKLLSYARMDNCRPIPQRMAIKKAYTSASYGRDSLVWAQGIDRAKPTGTGLPGGVVDYGDPDLVAVQGGVVILRPADGAVLGAIGVSGLTAQQDEDLARLGLEALGL